MGLDNIGLDPEMNGHDFRSRMREYENPTFLAYFQFEGNGERKAKKEKIKSIQRKFNAKLK